jgi:hypothetical protein
MNFLYFKARDLKNRSRAFFSIPNQGVKNFPPLKILLEVPTKHRIMAVEIITREDLNKFRRELLEDFKKLLKNNSGQPTKKWLKSFEVRKLLGISPGTLQNLRVNGTLPFTKVGGVLYYDQEDIQKMLQANKFQNRVFQNS